MVKSFIRSRKSWAILLGSVIAAALLFAGISVYQYQQKYEDTIIICSNEDIENFISANAELISDSDMANAGETVNDRFVIGNDYLFWNLAGYEESKQCDYMFQIDSVRYRWIRYHFVNDENAKDVFWRFTTARVLIEQEEFPRSDAAYAGYFVHNDMIGNYIQTWYSESEFYVFLADNYEDGVMMKKKIGEHETNTE